MIPRPLRCCFYVADLSMLPDALRSYSAGAGSRHAVCRYQVMPWSYVHLISSVTTLYLTACKATAWLKSPSMKKKRHNRLKPEPSPRIRAPPPSAWTHRRLPQRPWVPARHHHPPRCRPTLCQRRDPHLRVRGFAHGRRLPRKPTRERHSRLCRSHLFTIGSRQLTAHHRGAGRVGQPTPQHTTSQSGYWRGRRRRCWWRWW